MDSEDNLSNHSSNPTESHSDRQSSQNFSQNASSASSSSHGHNSRGSLNRNQLTDRHQDNTIGFDSFSDYSGNPLNEGFVRNQDSFYSDFKSLYSNRSRNLFQNSMDQNDIENPYESQSFNSFHSFVQKPEVKPQSGRKGSRERSRERVTRRSQMLGIGVREFQQLEFGGGRKGQTGFKKRK